MANTEATDRFVRSCEKMKETLREMTEMLQDLMEPPIFSGKGPEEWLRCLERYLKFNGTPANRRFSVARQCLEVSGKYWFDLISEIYPCLTWFEFKEFFLERFGISETPNGELTDKEAETVEVLASDLKDEEEEGDGMKQQGEETILDAVSSSPIVPKSDNYRTEVARYIVHPPSEQLIQQGGEKKKLLLLAEFGLHLQQEEGGYFPPFDLGTTAEVTIAGDKERVREAFLKSEHKKSVQDTLLFEKVLAMELKKLHPTLIQRDGVVHVESRDEFFLHRDLWDSVFVDTGQDHTPVRKMGNLRFNDDCFYMAMESEVSSSSFEVWNFSSNLSSEFLHFLQWLWEKEKHLESYFNGGQVDFLHNFYFPTITTITASQISSNWVVEWSPPFNTACEDLQFQRLESKGHIITPTNQFSSVFSSTKQSKIKIGEHNVNTHMLFPHIAKPTHMLLWVCPPKLNCLLVNGVMRAPQHNSTAGNSTKTGDGALQKRRFALYVFTTEAFIRVSKPNFYGTGQSHRTHTYIAYYGPRRNSFRSFLIPNWVFLVSNTATIKEERDCFMINSAEGGRESLSAIIYSWGDGCNRGKLQGTISWNLIRNFSWIWWGITRYSGLFETVKGSAVGNTTPLILNHVGSEKDVELHAEFTIYFFILEQFDGVLLPKKRTTTIEWVFDFIEGRQFKNNVDDSFLFEVHLMVLMFCLQSLRLGNSSLLWIHSGLGSPEMFHTVASNWAKKQLWYCKITKDWYGYYPL
ncbi:uncharacterized protein [Euphorbia lathyris]|uniref:uncharacterized protein n=1 Tax=Euphorbia lathyris TaxID=212925 RepID=UPI003313F4F7